jgi:rhodanese-related sulfurtransferase
MRKSLVVLAICALLVGLGGLASAQENPAGWEAAAKYLSNLPQGFNGVPGATLKAKLDAGEQLFLLDVREPNEYANGHIEGALNIPVRSVPASVDKIPQDKNAQIVVICASAVRSGYVVEALAFKGYTNVKHLAAGYVAGWEKAGYPVMK